MVGANCEKERYRYVSHAYQICLRESYSEHWNLIPKVRPYTREVNNGGGGLSVIHQTFIEWMLWRQREGGVSSQLFRGRGCVVGNLWGAWLWLPPCSSTIPIKQNIHHESWVWSVFTLNNKVEGSPLHIPGASLSFKKFHWFLFPLYFWSLNHFVFLLS